MFQRKKGQKGFTLIELLIVLTILAILVAVVVVSLTTFVGKGKTEACKTDRRSLQSAVVAFYSQGNGWPTANGLIPGDIDWTADDGTAHLFSPAYIIEVPESDTGTEACDWQIDGDGVVFPNAATCPCAPAPTPTPTP
jgi:prepilin-type N-terminal cleavage/methylation domain-containing protein